MKCPSQNATKIFVNCSNINATSLDRLALVRGTTGIICFVLCLATFIFELFYICHASRKKKQSGNAKVEKTTTLQRLFVYLTFSNILYTAALSLHIENYFNYNDSVHCYVCKVIGFFDQYSGSVQLLLTIGIIVKLFHKLRSFLPRKNIKKGMLSRHHFKFEALFVILCFVLPLLVIWVPFIQNGPGEYGQNPAWCWILVLKDDCSDSPAGFMEELFLWYVPFAAVSILSLICILLITVCLVYICVRHKSYWKHIRSVIFDILLLVPFLVVFCCVCIVEIAILVFFKLRQSNQLHHLNSYYMWMCYAVITPIGAVVIPIAFFVYHLRKKNFSLPQKLHDVSHGQYKTINPSHYKPVNSNSDEGRPDFRPSSVHWSTPSGSAVIIDPSVVRKGGYGTMD